jgi:hypothetical protein
MSTPEERDNRAARTHREAWILLEAERKARAEKTARLKALREAANEPLPVKKTKGKASKHRGVVGSASSGRARLSKARRKLSPKPAVSARPRVPQP